MPRDQRDPAARKPSPYEGAGSAAINATVARIAPAILELLAGGVPRSKAAIVEALAGPHARDDVVHALIRLAVTGQGVETGGRDTTTTAPEPGPGPCRREAAWCGAEGMASVPDGGPGRCGPCKRGEGRTASGDE